MKKSLVRIIGASIASMGLMGGYSDAKVETPENTPCIERTVIEPVLRYRTVPESKRTYSLKDIVEPGNYELRLNVMYKMNTDHNVSKNVTEIPYLEFIDQNDKDHKSVISLEDFDKSRKYEVHIGLKNKDNKPSIIDFKEKVYPKGKSLGTIKPSDMDLMIVSPETKVQLPPRTRTVYEKVEKEKK